MKDSWDKFKIVAEVIGIVVTLSAAICGGLKYFHSLEVDKSQFLYKDFVIEGIIPLELMTLKMAYAHFGPQSSKSFNRYRTIVSNLQPGIRYRELKEKYSTKKIKLDPVTSAEKEQLKKTSEEAVDLLHSKLLFLGREITDALNYSINLLRDETASIPSPNLYFSSPTDLPSGQENETIYLPDAYRYLILVNDNHRFLRDSLKTIADFILKENIHTYKKMAEISDKKDVRGVFEKLRNFKSLYLAYVNNWQGKPKEDYFQKSTELLVSFFEDYKMKEKKWPK